MLYCLRYPRAISVRGMIRNWKLSYLCYYYCCRDWVSIVVQHLVRGRRVETWAVEMDREVEGLLDEGLSWVLDLGQAWVRWASCFV